MSNDFASQLQREIAALEAELANDPRFLKLEKLREVLALYNERETHSDDRAKNADRSDAPSGPPVRTPTPNRLQAESLSAQLLEGRDRPTPTREIYDYLLAHGVEIGGKQPTSNLSAILSKNDKFKSVGRSGWLLVYSSPQTQHSSNEPEQSEAHQSEPEQSDNVDVGSEGDTSPTAAIDTLKDLQL